MKMRLSLLKQWDENNTKQNMGLNKREKTRMNLERIEIKTKKWRGCGGPLCLVSLLCLCCYLENEDMFIHLTGSE